MRSVKELACNGQNLSKISLTVVGPGVNTVVVGPGTYLVS